MMRQNRYMKYLISILFLFVTGSVSLASDESADANGEEKALKIIGINSIDLFSASVDEQIDELLNTIKTNSNSL